MTPEPDARDPAAAPRPGAGRRVLRVDLRREHTAPQPPADPAARPPTAADAEALAVLFIDAYRGTIDDEGETLDDARAVVRQLFDGGFGTMWWPVSEVVERPHGLAAATLVTRWEGQPFVAFSITAPAWQRQGLARVGLQRAMYRLAQGGEAVLRLVVTAGNTPAERLYAQLGFVDER